MKAVLLLPILMTFVSMAQDTVSTVKKPKVHAGVYITPFFNLLSSNNNFGRAGIDVYELGKKRNVFAGLSMVGKEFEDDIDQLIYTQSDLREEHLYSSHSVIASLSFGYHLINKKNYYLNARILASYQYINRNYSIYEEAYDSTKGSWQSTNMSQSGPAVVAGKQPKSGATTDQDLFGGGLELNLGTRFEKKQLYLALQLSPQIQYFTLGKRQIHSYQYQTTQAFDYLNSISDIAYLGINFNIDLILGIKLY